MTAAAVTITDEEAVALARDEAAVKLARETIALLVAAAALLRDAAARLEAAAERADWEIAGGAAPKVVAYQLIAATRQTAAYAQGKAVVR